MYQRYQNREWRDWPETGLTVIIAGNVAASVRNASRRFRGVGPPSCAAERFPLKKPDGDLRV